MEDTVYRLVPIMFAAVLALIGWTTKRFFQKTDEVEANILHKIDHLNDNLHAHRMESERRITRMEASIEHVETRLESIETIIFKKHN